MKRSDPVELEFIRQLPASIPEEMRAEMAALPRGRFEFEDALDNDGAGGGAPGIPAHVGEARALRLPGKTPFRVDASGRPRIETPGGGGFRLE